jgi:X-Pro dipeptidyl-peptidase
LRATAVCPRPTFPNDFGFAAGHRIGIILVASYASVGSVRGTAGSTVALDTGVNRLRLRILGGRAAAVWSGRFAC